MSVETAADGRRRGGEERESVVRRGIREAKPVLVKIGIAFALSFAGFVVSQLRPRSRPPTPQFTPSAAEESESEADGKNGCGCLHKELCVLKSEGPSTRIVNGISAAAAAVELSPTSNSAGDVEGFLLPEFDDLVMHEFVVKNEEPETALIATTAEEPALQEDIAHLRELVQSMKERERSLNLQLLEYRGVEQQKDAARELENRLKISAMEAKLYRLKIDSLQADNQRLQDELAEHSKSIKELEVAREEINRLESKMRMDEAEKKKILVSLHQKISSLQQREQKDAENNAVIERKLKMLEELEHENMQLKMVNSGLSEENSDLIIKLESSQMTISSVLDGAKVEVFEEANHLRRANEKLVEEIEQLRTDRCTDVEELVYLRWINACLRYELRNYQPSLGKLVARDLSRCLSPKSEEKAKHLILEYANLSADDDGLDFGEVDSEHSYSSQPYLGEPEDVPIDASSSARFSSSKKVKFISKLKKLVLGKSNQKNKVSAEGRTGSCGESGRRASISTCSIKEVIGRDSYDSLLSCVIDEVATQDLSAVTEAEIIQRLHDKDISFPVSSRLSLDMQRLWRLDQEEARDEKGVLGMSDRMMACGYKRVSFLEDTSTHGSKNTTDQEDTCIPEKVKIKKFADVLRSSRGGITKLNRRSSSCRY